MAYVVGSVVSVLLLIHLPGLTSSSNAKISNYEEFFVGLHSFLRTINLTQNKDLAMCTKIFIYNDTKNLVIPNGEPSIITSNIRPINQPTGVVRHSMQCSVVSIVNEITIIDYYNDEHWLQYIPGTFFNSFHFILTSEKFLGWMWDRPFLRRLANVIAFVDRGQRVWDLITPNRYNSEPRYFEVGKFHRGVLGLTSENCVLWNKWWNMQGVKLKVAVPPTQSEETFRLQAQGKVLLYPVTEIVETVRYLNSTPQVISMPVTSKRFGTKFPNGSWDGFMSKVMDDTADITYPFFPASEQYAAVFISKPVMFTQVKFFTPLPKKDKFTFKFLTKPFDTTIWTALLFCIITSALVVYVLKNTDDPKFLHKLYMSKLLPHRLKRVLSICSYFVRILIDQSMPSSVMNFLDRINGCRWLFIAWFLAAGVIGCHYKSVVVSVLVKPMYVYPPQNIQELIASDFQVNVPMYENVMKEGLIWRDQLMHPIKDFGFDFRGCLKTLLKGDNICLFLHHWLYLAAPLDLIDTSGNQLFLISRDSIHFVFNSFYISQRNPQLKAALDKVAGIITEGGLTTQWVNKIFYHRFLKTVRTKQKLRPLAIRTISEEADVTFMRYPMAILLAGYVLAMCCHIYLYLYHGYLRSKRMLFRRSVSFISKRSISNSEILP